MDEANGTIPINRNSDKELEKSTESLQPLNTESLLQPPADILPSQPISEHLEDKLSLEQDVKRPQPLEHEPSLTPNVEIRQPPETEPLPESGVKRPHSPELEPSPELHGEIPQPREHESKPETDGERPQTPAIEPSLKPEVINPQAPELESSPEPAVKSPQPLELEPLPEQHGEVPQPTEHEPSPETDRERPQTSAIEASLKPNVEIRQPPETEPSPKSEVNSPHPSEHEPSPEPRGEGPQPPGVELSLKPEVISPQAPELESSPEPAGKSRQPQELDPSLGPAAIISPQLHSIEPSQVEPDLQSKSQIQAQPEREIVSPLQNPPRSHQVEPTPETLRQSSDPVQTSADTEPEISSQASPLTQTINNSLNERSSDRRSSSPRESIEQWLQSFIHCTLYCIPLKVIKQQLTKFPAVNEFLRARSVFFILILLFAMALINVCVLYLPLVVVLTIAVAKPRQKHQLIMLLLTTGYSVLVQLIKIVIFELDKESKPNCTVTPQVESKINTPLTYAFGTNTAENYLISFLMAVFMNGMLVIVWRLHTVKKRNDETNRSFASSNILLFPKANIKDAGKSFEECFKFLMTWGFYKFGFELFLVAMVLNVHIRMDFISLITMLSAIVTVVCKRFFDPKKFQRWLIIFVGLESVLIILQYTIIVGLPPFACVDYPWQKILANYTESTNMIVWFNWPDYQHAPNAAFLLLDFIVLLLAGRLFLVLRKELACGVSAGFVRSTSRSGIGQISMTLMPVVVELGADDTRKNINEIAGNNKPSDMAVSFGIIDEDQKLFGFVSERKCMFDYMKAVVFKHGFWFTFATIFVAGVTNSSIFGVAYLLLAMVIIGRGNRLFLLEKNVLSKSKWRNYLRKIENNIWLVLLFYSAAVMLIKVLLQLVGCVFVSSLTNACWLRQLFSIVCLDASSGSSLNLNWRYITEKDSCDVRMTAATTFFDLICFVCVLIQQRIVESSYFKHCILQFFIESQMQKRGKMIAYARMEYHLTVQREDLKKAKDDAKKKLDKYSNEMKTGYEPISYGHAKRGGECLLKPPKNINSDSNPNSDGSSSFDEDGNIANKENDNGDRSAEGSIENVVKENFDFVVEGMTNLIYMVNDELYRWSRDYRFTSYFLKNESTQLRRLLLEKTQYMAEPQVIEGWRQEAAKCLQKFPMPNINRNEYWRLKDQIKSVQTVLDYTRKEMKNNIANEENYSKYEEELRKKKSNLVKEEKAITNTHILCYALVVIDQAASAALLTLPLMILVFAYGALRPPRPTKFTWQALIFWVWFVAFFQFLMKLNCLPWNSASYLADHGMNEPAFWPFVIGIHPTPVNTLIHIVLLIALCLHREQLQKSGLWEDDQPALENAENEFQTEFLCTKVDIDGEFNNEKLKLKRRKLKIEPLLTITDQKEPEQQTYQEFTQLSWTTHGFSESFLFKLLSGLHFYFRRTIHNRERYALDMFPLQLVCYIMILIQVTIWYTDFGIVGEGFILLSVMISNLSYIFVVYIGFVFLLLIIDRAIYNASSAFGRIIFHLFMFVSINVYALVVIPWLSGRALVSNYTAMCFYMIFGLYMIASSAQIRHGYPENRQPSLFTRPENKLSRLLFIMYMRIPFAFEIVTFLDFACTNTKLAYRDFFTLETIYARVYELKCIRHKDGGKDKVTNPRSILITLLIAVGILSFVFIVIFFPLILYSFNNVYGTQLYPDRVTVVISVDGYPALYHMRAEGEAEITPLNKDEYQWVLETFKNITDPNNKTQVEISQQARRFINGYRRTDVIKMLLLPKSAESWAISEGSRAALQAQLPNKPIRLNVYFEFRRERQNMDMDMIVQTSLTHVNLTQETRQAMANMLAGEQDNVTIKKAWPPYGVVPGLGAVRSASQLMNAMNLNNEGFVDLLLQLRKNNATQREEWSMKMLLPPNSKVLQPVLAPGNGTDLYVQQVIFVDKVLPNWLNVGPVKNGIYAIFAGIVMIFWLWMRTYLVKSPLELMLIEIPNVEPLYEKCQDVYLLRSVKPFNNKLEVQMYSQLVHLFRSPAHLIEFTRPAELQQFN
uniref:Piezo-type mechanosensitive ion channel component n=1 Tax=Plectus sambesii TaxID=2011161 RepID=A0A914VCD5_9BILA